jgi:uncharacterized protein (DUF1015 family)
VATIKPFAALRPDPKLAPKICELPYDVMSSAEARVLAQGNPTSFLHVSKPEIDLPDSVDVHAEAVYAKGRENFQRLIAEGALRQESRPCFYFYRQIMGGHAQTGLVALASCQEYLNGIVKKHELTRPDKEDDRVKHIETLNAQTGKVFLAYRAVKKMDELAARKTAEAPDIDFIAPDGVRHTSWTVNDDASIRQIEAIFAGIPSLYIADGHHRTAAAGRVFKTRQGAGGSAYFLSVIFPHNQLQILPYYRALKDLHGLDGRRQLLERLQTVFDLAQGDPPQPARKHNVGLYIEGSWIGLRFRPEILAAARGIDALDVSLLQKHVLAPVFGIDDPRTSQRISFIGGIRGTGELEKVVNSGEFACAFSMFPTSMDDLMAIADAGGIMPPKSTWFEPKLRDAMFSYLI